MSRSRWPPRTAWRRRGGDGELLAVAALELRALPARARPGGDGHALPGPSRTGAGAGSGPPALAARVRARLPAPPLGTAACRDPGHAGQPPPALAGQGADPPSTRRRVT